MSDIPILKPPLEDNCCYHWHHQFTITLLFDDCLSLLQKVCALWNKLNDVIGALNDFNDEFNQWARSVEAQLKDLYSKYTALEGRVTKTEQDIANIKTTLENIQNTLTDLGNRLTSVERNLTNLTKTVNNLSKTVSDLTTTVNDLKSEFNTFKQNVTNNINKLSQDLLDLENRVDALENLLSNLNIIPPQTILDLNNNDSAWATLWGKWWNWFSANCINFASGDSKSNWVMSGNIEWWDTVTKPQRTIKVGYLGQPVCLVKLPFIAVRKNVWTSEPTIDQIKAKAPTFKTEALTPTLAFFDLPLTQEFGFTIDEVKVMTSYIPYVTDKSHIIKMPSGESAFATQTDVRIQIPKTGKNAKLCVIPQRMCVAAVPNSVSSTTATAWDLYIYAIAENG